MGLLQKATESESNTPESRKMLINNVYKRLSLAENRIEFYPTLFQEFVNLFSIEKGALLLKEGEMYTLASIIGFDETTKNRLRFTANEYNQYKADDNINIFKPYFSIREFITLKYIKLYPFENNNQIEYFLLISEYKTETNPRDEEIEQTIEFCKPLIKNNPLQKLKTVNSHRNEDKDEIATIVQKIKTPENRVFFLKLNLSNLIKTIKDGDNLSTNTSIRSSSIKILNSFVKNRGKLFQLQNNDLLLALTDNHGSTNISVVQQQINGAFRSIFSKKLNAVDLNYETLIWQNNSLDTILDHFIQYASVN